MADLSAAFRRPTGLTGPVPVATPSDAAYWFPGYDEPIYSGVYQDLRDQLLAGLRAGTIGEQVPAC